MEHHFCIFYKNNHLTFGWIKEIRKSRLIIVPEKGDEVVLSQSRIEYSWKGKSFLNAPEAISHINEKTNQLKKDLDTIDLNLIHELCEIGQPYTLDQLSDDFLSNPDDGWEKVALLIKLKEDSLLFQQKKKQFLARSPEDIENSRIEIQKKEQTQKKQIVEGEWVEKYLKKEPFEIQDHEQEHRKQFLHRLKNFLLYMEKSQEKEYICSLFNCRMSDSIITERRILDYLSNTEKKLSWGQLVLERASVDLAYDEDEKKAANEKRLLDIWSGFFKCQTVDQREFETYTVDNSETKDFDDAVSWKKGESGSTIYIHIADVASFINKNEYIFQKAEKRISSLYSVKEVYSMMHPDLSENILSLVEKNDRAVITFEVQLNHDSEIVSSEIYRSIISVNENLSYQYVDELIEKESSFWSEVWEFCQKLREERKEKGSLEIERSEILLDISDPARITIKEVRENTPASLMIQELAIFTNYQAACFCRDHNLQSLFRHQPPYSVNADIEEGTPLTIKDIHIQPARISLEPDPHSALGLECYLQVTSPIRRFSDLINQGIIFNSLSNNEILYSSEELLVWAKRAEEIQREYGRLERELLNHWKIKYLSQNKEAVYKAQLIRYFRKGKAQINILDVQLYVDAFMEGLNEDEIFDVVLDDVDPKYNKVVIRRYEQAVNDVVIVE